MKTSKLLQSFVLAASLSAVSTVSAQVLTPGGVIQGPSTLGTKPPRFPRGPLGHVADGAFGQFTTGDNWAALGESPFPSNGVSPYGLRLQKLTQFSLFNLVTNVNAGINILDPFALKPEDLVIGWGEDNGSVVRFRFISNQFTGASTDALVISPNGNLSAAGLIFSPGALVTSDQRFKEQIAPLANSLDLIRKIQGTTYQFKQTGEFASRHFPVAKQYGFIAQDLQKVLPEAVVKQEDGYYAVNYIAVVPILVEAVKQLDAKQAENAKLQERLIALDTQMAELRAMVQSIGKASTGQAGASGADMSQVKLEQNAPNPFKEATRIEYSLPAGTTGAVLTISDMQGYAVKTVSDLSSGRQVVEVKAGSLPAGIYIYTLSVGGKEVTSKRMVLTR